MRAPWLLGLALLAGASARPVNAQTSTDAPDSNAPAASPPALDEDLEFDKSEPDFTVITLPTNLRLPLHKMGFLLTHRFTTPLGQGDFSDLLSRFFGFDGGAQIGLGLRFGLFRGTQLAIYRTNNRDIQFFLQSELVSARRHPIGISLHASVEGMDNFSEQYAPGLSLVVSRKLGTRGALYLVPRWVENTNALAKVVTPGLDTESTFVLGLGVRLRLVGGTYFTGEYLPRLAGYKGDFGLGFGDGQSLVTFALEEQVGGHSFQINFSNDTGTSPRQTAVGRPRPTDWYLGFNITRKFY